jgi:hypothetical protein
MFAGSTYWLVKPLLSDPALTNARVEIIRRDDAGTDLSGVDLSYVGPSITQKVKGAGKYVSVSRMEFKTDGRHQGRVLLTIDDARPFQTRFCSLDQAMQCTGRPTKNGMKNERSHAIQTFLYS